CNHDSSHRNQTPKLQQIASYHHHHHHQVSAMFFETRVEGFHKKSSFQLIIMQASPITATYNASCSRLGSSPIGQGLTILELFVKQDNGECQYRKMLNQLVVFDDNVWASEATQIERFIGGLRNEIQVLNVNVRFATVAEAMTAAESVEREQNMAATKQTSKGKELDWLFGRPSKVQKMNQIGQKGQSNGTTPSAPMIRRQWPRCKLHHQGFHCNGDPVQCYEYKGYGHLQGVCPTIGTKVTETTQSGGSQPPYSSVGNTMKN
ncbi:Unknown protein, partial [Striga hermonthica]